MIDFDFGTGGPDPETLNGKRFAIRWKGSVVPPETGHYEFVVRTAHSVRLAVNSDEQEPPLIDASVQSGDRTEHRGTISLYGGRPYPLRLEFSKANQGVDNKENEKDSRTPRSPCSGGRRTAPWRRCRPAV